MGILDKFLSKSKNSSDSTAKKQDETIVEAKKDLEKLLKEGKVKKVLLLPTSLGGQNIPQNTTWLPILSIPMKEKIDQSVYNTVERGEQVEYVVTPVYDDSSKASMIPAKLHLQAKGTQGTKIDITIVIDKSQF